MILFQCPNCQQSIETPDHIGGTNLGCPHCGSLNEVPGTLNSISPPPPPRLAYILLAVFLGNTGIHNFMAGYISRGVVQLVLSFLFFWTIIIPFAIYVWAIVEACTVWQDAHGRTMK
ncbi:TM2 domain-containing protein [PVC group bacterium]|nr:TM2 domain-containing protein [PVC group bacterium]